MGTIHVLDEGGFADTARLVGHDTIERSFLAGGYIDYDLEGCEDLADRIIRSRLSKKYQKVVELCDEALTQFHGDYGLLNEKGVALKELGRLTEADACFDEAISSSEAFPQAYRNKGVVFYLLGNVRGALEWVYKALEVDPEWTMANANAMLFHDRLGEYEEARRHLDIVNERVIGGTCCLE